MKRLTLAIAGAVSMFGCVGQALGADKVADVDAADVAHCTFVQDVSGRSVFARLQEQGLAKAKEAARAQAEKAGANSIVWGEVTQTDVTIVAGKAYRCPK